MNAPPNLPPPNATPAGWYADPQAPTTLLRYWDGYRWTGITREPPKGRKWGDPFVLWSLLAALVFPPAAWVCAIVLLTRGRGSDAFAVFLVSIVGWFVIAAVIA